MSQTNTNNTASGEAAKRAKEWVNSKEGQQQIREVLERTRKDAEEFHRQCQVDPIQLLKVIR